MAVIPQLGSHDHSNCKPRVLALSKVPETLRHEAKVFFISTDRNSMLTHIAFCFPKKKQLLACPELRHTVFSHCEPKNLQFQSTRSLLYLGLLNPW